MKSLLTLAIAALSGVGVIACGGTSKINGSAPASSATTAYSTSPATSGAPAGKDSNDKDDDAAGNDDTLIVNYGHEATIADKKAVTVTLERYFTAAAADDGARACSTLVSIVAEAVPEEYGEAPAPPSLRGKTCTVVMSKLFKERHRELIAKSATLKVIEVRVEGDNALAILHFSTTPEPQKIVMHREGPNWKVRDLLDSKMP
jgi:hypothetical protein